MVFVAGEHEGFVTSEIPHQVAFAGGGRAQQGLAHVLAARTVTFRQPGLGDLAERRQQVDGADDAFVVDLPGLDDARPADDEGHADAAFVEAVLDAAHAVRAQLAETRRRTVVRGEDDDGVVAQSQLVELREEAPDLAVVLGEHLREVGLRVPVLLFVLRLFVGNPRRVHVVGPEVDEAGLVFVAHHEVERLVDEVARAVPAFHVVLVAPYPVRGGQFGSRIGAFPRRTVFVEAECGDLRGVFHVAAAAHVPFAEVSGSVACVVEDAGH